MKRRILSIITALALCLSLCPTWAFAAETDPALCPHHPAHTGECGYIAPTEGQPCGHEHTEDCYTTDEAGGEVLDCQHTHDEDCGYVQADPGQPCGYECRVCPIEALIAALPEEVTADNADGVRGRLDQILALFSELTEEEQEQIDLSRVYELQEALDGANDPAPAEGHSDQQEGDKASVTAGGTTAYYTSITGAWTAAAANSGSTVTLLADVEISSQLEVPANTEITLDCTGHTLTGTYGTIINNLGTLHFKGGTLHDTFVQSSTGISTGICIYMQSGSVFTMSGGTLISKSNTVKSSSGSTIAIEGGTLDGDLFASAGSTVSLSGGTYSKIIVAYAAGKRQSDCLAEGCVFYRDGAPLTREYIDGQSDLFDVTVQKCNHAVASYTDNGDGTHAYFCPACGLTKNQPHTLDGAEGDERRTCTACGYVQQPAEARVERNGVTTDYTLLRDALTDLRSGSDPVTATITLLRDVAWEEGFSLGYVSSRELTLDLNGKSLSAPGCVLALGPGVTMTIQDSSGEKTGKISSRYLNGGEGVITLNDAALRLTSGSVYGDYGIWLNGGSLAVSGDASVGGKYRALLSLDGSTKPTVRLSGGRFYNEDSYPTVSLALPLLELLATDHAFYDREGRPILLEDNQTEFPEGVREVTVKPCTHDKSVCAYTPNEDADTHAMTCRACGLEGAVEDCQLTYTSNETQHTAACETCGRTRTEAHSYGSWEPKYNGNTVTIRRICENCKYTKTDGTITAPSEIQTMEYGTPITLTCSSTLPDATFRWSLMDADIGADRTPVQESTGTSFTPSETLAVGKYFWEAIVKWAGSDNNIWSSGDWLQVTPAPLPDATLSPASAVYNGTEQKPAVAIAGLTAGTDYTVAYTGDFTNAGTHTVTVTGQGNYEGTVTKTFTIEKATLNVEGNGIAAGTYGAKLSGLAVSGLTAKLNGTEVPGTWKLAGAAIPNAGDTETHAAAFTPAGGGENYKPLTAQVTLNIAKAPALPTKPGDLAVANGRAHTYTYGLGALRPDVPEGMSLGSAAVTYELGTVSLGSYYDSAKDGAKIEGQTLTLPIEAVESNSETGIGTITVTIHTGNYEDMTATINVRSVNKTVPTGEPTLSTDTLNYGQTLSAITLSGSMQDNGTSVPGTFAWSSPDNRPAVQEKYAAAWTFTPTDNGKYAIVTGTALIRVLPAPIAGAVIVLEPSAFRYQEGKTQKPSITSVTLNGTELTADADYTAAIPEGTAAGTYTVTLCGMGNYTGEATATFTINPVEQKPLDQKDDAGNELRLEVETGISEVPAGLQGIVSTPEELETAMRTEITQATPGIPQANTAVYDVTLMVSTNGGATWTPATASNFPTGGLTVTLPYPSGTNSSYRFTVVHMFTTSDFPGKNPGDTEVFTPDKVKNTTQGLQVVVTGLSPISVGWMAPETTPDTPSGGNHGGGGGGGSVSTYAVTVEKSEHGKVTSNRTNASSNSTVTLTVTPDSGYVLDTLTVTDSRGNEIKLTAQGGGKYTFTMPSRAVTVKASFVLLPDDTQKPCDGGADCPSRSFTDLGSVGTWYHEAVDYVLRNGLMGGYGNGTFGPNNNLTRAQFAQILFNKEGKPVVNYLLQYGDVAEGAWYTEAVRWATSQGVVGGYGNGLFGPNDNITREQLAVMLWRYAGSPAATDKELHFTDADQIGGYALEALRWAVENGVMNGKSGGVLDPQGLATRAQVAQMLMNFLNK